MLYELKHAIPLFVTEFRKEVKEEIKEQIIRAETRERDPAPAPIEPTKEGTPLTGLGGSEEILMLNRMEVSPMEHLPLEKGL